MTYMRNSFRWGLVLLIIGMMSGITYSKEIKEFKNYGIKFNYPSDYKLEHSTNKHYKSIKVFSRKAVFVVQIYNNEINPQEENAFVAILIKTMTKEHVKITLIKKSKKYLSLNDERNNEQVGVSSNHYHLKIQVTRPNFKKNYFLNIFFVRYNNRSYMFTYQHPENKPQDADFKTIMSSITILSEKV